MPWRRQDWDSFAQLSSLTISAPAVAGGYQILDDGTDYAEL